MPMNGVKYLVGSDELESRPLPVYSEEAVAFLSDLSARLLRMPDVRAYPDVVSAAFWCRRANLLKRREAYGKSLYRLGRGLAFHIAPSNIPVNFVFTYFFSLLAGNISIVRVPSKPFPQISILCGAFQSVLPRHPEVASRTAFITYPVRDEITAAFCAMADLRVIWGGDRTIADVRRHPTKPKCLDIVFPDRYSICVLDGSTVLESSEAAFRRLIDGFYNDTFLMDQNACSSPQIIFWLNGSADVRERFWGAVLEAASQRYRLPGILAVDKYVHLCEDAIEHSEVSRIFRQGGNLLYRAQLSALPALEKTALRGRGGYFYEYDLRSLDELCEIVDEKYQTLTYFGVDPEKVRESVIRNRLVGIDRIVPVGSAMDIDVIWDGYDLVTLLSRKIDVK